jgi:hypothetical protein
MRDYCALPFIGPEVDRFETARVLQTLDNRLLHTAR